ncbi:SLAP domain-containing protein [Bombilactobacillus bombi]|uniref:SLAP domain-containing protein n=1 Tax=Bombilactobacillus bombi TaxID=1303590 RepID=UPI0015E5E828|nr:SLAP domain-containing protein [Bombilactobacillus bombi]MBA1434281.1 hypothetical protein [Bombilactobacillus bombi]
MKKNILRNVSLTAVALLAAAPVITTSATVVANASEVQTRESADVTAAKKLAATLKEGVLATYTKDGNDDGGINELESYGLTEFIKDHKTDGAIKDGFDTDGKLKDKYGVLQYILQDTNNSVKPADMSALKDGKFKVDLSVKRTDIESGHVSNSNEISIFLSQDDPMATAVDQAKLDVTRTNANKFSYSDINLNFTFTVGGETVKKTLTWRLIPAKVTLPSGIVKPAEGADGLVVSLQEPQTLTSTVGKSVNEVALSTEGVGVIINTGTTHAADSSHNISNKAVMPGKVYFYGNEVKSSSFEYAGTYTQDVTINLLSYFTDASGNVDKTAYTSALNSGKILINKDYKSGAAPTSWENIKLDSKFNKDTGTYTFTRKIVVNSSMISPSSTVAPTTPSTPTITSNDTPVDGTVAMLTGSNFSTVQVYDANGHAIANDFVELSTSFTTNTKHTVDGVNYYKIGDGRYVRADQVIYTQNGSNATWIDGGVSVSDITPNVIHITASNSTHLWKISADGNQMLQKPSRLVAERSPWRTTQKAVINGATFYNVSSNEWVKATDGSLEK